MRASIFTASMIAFLGFAPASAFAAAGSYLCAIGEVHECLAVSGCKRVSPKEVNLSPFITVDLDNKKLSSVAVGRKADEEDVEGITVTDKARVGEHCVFGAGAVVIGEIPPNSVAVGMPARVVRTLEPYVPPPSFETNAECQIVAKLPGGDEPMSRERALRELNTCSEFIEAAYDHEQHHKDICIRSNSTARAQMRIEAYAAEESAGYAREIGRLEDRLRQYWGACSARADVKTARVIANAGIAALKK